ncbi:MAG: GTP-binding protein TypA [Alphaproteobacteria bacterium RIFCSPLOWO2_01_FULL_40_26]|nr:MAG: GTP-binding protein TypA [Alphaproteobacteria bacterium RIFCSPHIGHO2_02_FULL_40_34]OFW88099.1 MAG: GTP-binding protein TypA [Alphaproteobacteria bacterium RIFCSPHIGHO2_01_FULL_40_8]OFW95034.1 MAG: GTP-binding protein TypA [Alphaproteobacteria bacterium RIFCSPLOWO2_01_FULL_40_26]OFX10530.1 MAG: GTP-binding protein TypA [Alphaproteobacteria bacterium RIFCSPLOWO2_02_FULL_40_19]OFX12112.1 MAG: GTP-binding protein TypA [Alphaproteobacteria bacterium RIFCSPLOWO2_12_FULL_40_11]
MTDFRNIAIIAHVDHGKTTLIDAMLHQSGTFRANQQVETRVMDSNALEKERGITILAKCTSLMWGGNKINVIDTPGHADFGGEVERVLCMADSCLLLVDSAEGVMPQTKFVLSKALAIGLRPIVIINKIDRQDARPDEVLNEIFDLFVSLNANDAQLDFPVLYAVGRDGWCVRDIEKDQRKDLSPLFDLILEHITPPKFDTDAPFKMLATLLDHSPYFGRMLTGRIYSGRAKNLMSFKAINLKGEVVEQGRLTKLHVFRGVEKVAVEEAKAGDIVSIAGLEKASVSDTLCDLSVFEPIKSTPIDPPTMAITIGVNDSPLAGTEGSKVTSRMIRDRLFAEAETNVAIKVKESGAKDAFEVGGRGELQLGVLIENMRREGFELSVSRPRVLFKKGENDEISEPVEEVVVDVDDNFSGVVVEKLSSRKGEMIDMRPSTGGKTRIIFYVPSRGLIGYQSEFLTDTKGTGVLNRIFHAYIPYKGEMSEQKSGALIATDPGEAVAYALWNLQERGALFIKPQQKVYSGMVVGENSKQGDLEVNVLKGKQLTNIRASGTDEAIRLTPPRELTLEDMITYVGDDELVEVTPKSLRLRKKVLDSNERKRLSRSKEAKFDFV